MKKIGLVTVTYVNNFGSHLQSFALQHVLQSLGYETEIITPEGLFGIIAKRRLRYLLSRWYDLGELKGYFAVARNKIMQKIDKEFGALIHQRSVVFNSFANKEYIVSPVTRTWEELSVMCSERYSSIVIGSDQNWRPANIAGGYYTIEYVPERVNKVAYSTSFGISHVISAQREKAKFFLDRIEHLSVREDTGQKIIKELIGRDVPVVCDPTILVKKEEWDALIEQKSQTDLSEVVSEPYIFCYFLGESQENRVFSLKLKEKTGLRIVSVLYGEGRYYKEKEKYYDVALTAIGPLDFVRLISKADYVCTDSFHGSAFSMVFRRQFFAFYKSSQNSKMSVNSRIDSMLGWAGIPNRIIKRPVEVIDDSLMTPINYDEVGKQLEKKREFSLQFLITSLK